MRTIVFVLASGLVLASSACGQKIEYSAPQTQTQPDPGPVDPDILTGLSPAERAKYCLFYLDGETDPDLSAKLEPMLGTWIHHPGPDENYRRREFLIDRVRDIAAITTYYDIGKDVEDIQFRKICLSKELDDQAGPWKGYRVLELMAANNDGGTAMLTRFNATGDGTELWVSEYHYDRWASDSIYRLPKLLASPDIRKVWVYQERQ